MYLEIILSSAVVSGLISFVGKLWIQNAIKNKYDKALETLKSELKVVEAKQNIIFSKLHTDRVDVIAEIYALLKDVHLNMQRFMKLNPIPAEESKETYLQNTKKAFNALDDYYPKKLIYLPKQTADKLEDVAKELQILFITHQTVSQFFSVEGNSQQEINKVLQQMPNVLVALEDEFRILLGDIQNKNSDRLN
jgi:metallophosphoesterase superfamily enzyme